MANPSGARISFVLVIVVGAALAVGAASSILVGATTAAPPPATGSNSQVLLPMWVFFLALFGFLAVIVASWVLLRMSSEAKGVSNRALASILLSILIISLFVIGLRVVGVGGAPPATGPGGTIMNSTSPNSTAPNPNASLPGVGSVTLFPSLAPWVPFAVLGVVVLVLVVVGVPQTRRYLGERRSEANSRRRPGPEDAAKVRAALTLASAKLDLGGDPRFVILGLYYDMLLHLRPLVGSVETSTPEEIRATHLARLGVRPEAAHTLTRLFEEARYSTHPMGPLERDRAKDAVRATLDDMNRRTSPE